jgi:pimeloyl-ACP methyl ester carboxylesterase
VADLMRHLEQTNALSPPDRPGDQGTIEIQTLRVRDGSLRHVVYLPGTDDLTTTPLSQDADVRDLATNLRLLSGEPTTYAAGIERAMREAGVRPDDPVLLVGHSQGGMEAAGLLARGSPFRVTDVVTAGSPIAQVGDYPVGSHVLSLENRGDVVPALDGADNPDAAEHVTVQFDDHETSIAGNHALIHYIRGAAAVDASADPSVREQVTALRQQGFLEASVVGSRVFQVTR